MSSPKRVLVLGGYGNFGARICRALAREGVDVIAAGRDPDRGHRNASFDDRIGKARIDIASSRLTDELRALSPYIVIHCVGPFQSQGYDVARAVLAAGAHYIDLADGRSFVADFPGAIDETARAKDLLAVSGASTLPGLSAAVVDSLRASFRSVDEIQISIAPGQRAPRGVATLKAVFSYAGKPIRWRQGGAWKTTYGWLGLRRFRIAGVGRRWAAACDVPDLEIFPRRYPGVKTIQFRAALELGIEHLFLAAVSSLIRIGIPIPLQRWAAAFDRAASMLDRFGTERGGMLVSLAGTKTDGTAGRLEWHLVADHNHGPEIPCMAAILLAKKILRNEIAIRGAMPCVDLLTLDEFTPEFARWGIETSIESR